MTGAALVVGVDLEHLDERSADHELHRLVVGLPAGAVRVAGTHWASSGGRPHVTLSLELVDVPAADAAERLTARLEQHVPRWSLAVGADAHGDAGLQDAAAAARDAHVTRRSGRVVHFPGVETLVGTLTVQELLDRSAVDRVRVLTAGDAAPDVRVVTRNHVRPTWVDGELVLLTQPAVGGTVVPFESPSPTACCADQEAAPRGRLSRAGCARAGGTPGSGAAP